MTIQPDNYISSILESLSRIDYIKLEDIPNIELYMDQITTFMNTQLEASKRYPNDKILTKTMINNYTKNDLLPPPVKKKYSKEHILVLIFIYYFKNILSINDIQNLLAPITEKYFKTEKEFDLSKIYAEVFELEKSEVERLKEDVLRKYEIAQETFQNAPAKDQEFLKLFSFICMLSFDVYVKKMLIEKTLDEMAQYHIKKDE